MLGHYKIRMLPVIDPWEDDCGKFYIKKWMS
jgi:hypothetical protein